MGRSARWSALLFSALGPFAMAQDPTPSASPSAAPERFLIESITVSGTERESVQRVVSTSSRLDLGHEYSEAEIRDGIHRVKRLPFVLDARPALRRGSARGTYELVIEIEEAVHFQVGADGFYTIESARQFGVLPHYGAAGVTPAFDRFLSSDTQIAASTSASVGTGRTGPRWNGAGVSVSKYDLAGHGSWLRLDANVSGFDGGSDYLRLSTALVLPVGRNQSLSAGVGMSRLDNHPSSTSDAFGGPSVDTTTSASIGWSYDRTDDPFAAREGLRLGVGTTYWHTSSDTSKSNAYQPSAAWQHNLTARYFRPVARHVSFFAVAYNFCTQTQRTDCQADPGIGLRFVQVGRRNRYRAFADIETRLSASYSRTQGTFVSGTIVTSVGLRAPWGALQFTFACIVR